MESTAAASHLSLGDRDIDRAGHLLIQFLKDYERAIPTSAAILPTLNRSQLEELRRTPFKRAGTGIEAIFKEIQDKIVPNSTTVAHPRFLAYVLGPPNGIAPFAEAVAAALNQNCNFWQLSPAANVIEQKVIAWLSDLFDYPAAAGGIITSGGSMATLTALRAALCDKCPADLRETGLQSRSAPLVLYTSTEAHDSVEKAATLLGLGSNQVRKIPVDDDFQMRVDVLRAAIRADREAGKQPFCVVASAGTINTGAVDPIAELASLCREEDLWLHVDGAYGALFVLAARTRETLRLCGLADSIVLDPHKLLFAPLEAGCLIVRDRVKLRHAFGGISSYLPADRDPLLMNFMEYGPQLSRGFKAFKIWCALEVFGVDAFARAADPCWRWRVISKRDFKLRMLLSYWHQSI